MSLAPLPVFAFNPGPLTGAGNTTRLMLGQVPTLISVGTTLAVLSIMRRRWVVKAPEPALTPA